MGEGASLLVPQYLVSRESESSLLRLLQILAGAPPTFTCTSVPPTRLLFQVSQAAALARPPVQVQESQPEATSTDCAQCLKVGAERGRWGRGRACSGLF